MFVRGHSAIGCTHVDFKVLGFGGRRQARDDVRLRVSVSVRFRLRIGAWVKFRARVGLGLWSRQCGLGFVRGEESARRCARRPPASSAVLRFRHRMRLLTAAF